MTLLEDIKAFLKKTVKNPILVGGLAYIVWKILSGNAKAEKIRVLKKIGNMEIIYDEDQNLYYLIDGLKAIPAKSLIDAEKKAGFTMTKLENKRKLNALHEKICLTEGGPYNEKQDIDEAIAYWKKHKKDLELEDVDVDGDIKKLMTLKAQGKKYVMMDSDGRFPWSR